VEIPPVPDQPAGLPFAIYARLSRLKAKPRTSRRTGRRRKDDATTARQVQLSRAYAADRGLPVDGAHVYIDNARSAWKATGARPDWGRLMAAAKRHEIAGVIGFKIDRLSRNVRDAEDLIDASEAQPLVLEGPGSGRIDLATANGRREFRQATVQAAAESDNSSERIKAALAEMAADGYPLAGGRLFGFELLNEAELPDDGEDEDGPPLTAVIRPAEAEVIREAARRMLDREPVAAIAASLNERGITTVRGSEWNARNLARTMGHAAYGGYVELHGRRAGQIKAEGGPVLDEKTFENVQALLASRRRGRRPTGAWPLTGVMRCGHPKCVPSGRTLAGYTEHRVRADGTRARRYVCAIANGGCGLSVRAAETEEIVTAAVLAELADPDEVRVLSEQAAALGEAREAAAARVGELDEALAELEDKKANGEIRPLAYGRAKATYDRRIAEAEAELQQAQADAAAARHAPAVTPAEWAAMTPAERRALIAALRLAVTVMPHPDGAPRNTFVPERVIIEPLI
jgi:site-specific DNA recombinase